MFLISLFVSYSVIKRHSLAINLSLFLVTFSVIVLIDVLLFKNAIYMKIIPPISSLLVSFIIAVAYSYATEGRQRLFLKNTILQFMDKKIADFLLDNPSLIKPGGQKKRVTVFFADIAGFTTMSEKIAPEKIATLLHTVLNSLTDVIIRNQGVIDKYIGDCVMAFWGAPFERDNDELNACYSAIQCMEAINQLNEGFRSEGSPDLNIRIGIHTGDAIAGNIGSDRLFHFTVIGDTLNLASRLESVNKFFKTRVIISEETIKKTKNTFLTRELGSIAVKGKEFPIRIFELIGDDKDTGPRERSIAELFHQGMQYHNEQKFKGAMEIFDEILKKYPGDGCSEFYRRRCADQISVHNLTEDWNIIKFTEK
jgi:adenylate cyclase